MTDEHPGLIAARRVAAEGIDNGSQAGREIRWTRGDQIDYTAVPLMDPLMDLPTDCPVCGKESIYSRGDDRYLHTDGTDNRACWIHLSKGLPTPDDPGEPKFATQLLTRSALKNLPDPEPLIDNVLDQGTTALLYGKWGTLKSFIALDWAASVATGRDWQGRNTEKRHVLYVAAEGAFGYKGRVDAWEQGWHTTIHDDDLDILPRPVNLLNVSDMAELAALIRWAGYGLIIIDTLARCMVGADENSAKDCGEVVDVLHALRACTPDGRGVILGVHHTGKDGKTFRGSSVFEAGADTVYSTTADGAAVTLNREKRKDGPKEDRHELKLDPIPGTGSAVISVHRGVDKSDRANRLLSTFVHHFSGQGATKSELRLVADMPQGTFYRALSDLLQRGDLVNTGTEKRPFYKQTS